MELYVFGSSMDMFGRLELDYMLKDIQKMDQY